MKAWILILALLHVVQVHNTLAATLVQPDECELIINDFSDAAAFAASINALGHFIGDDGTMLQFSLDGDADALNLVPGPGAFWYTNLRDGDICKSFLPIRTSCHTLSLYSLTVWIPRF